MADSPAQKFGRYRVVGELGRGAMGVVYKAEDDALGRTVAVKTILLSSDSEERAEYEARFYQEAKAAAALNHPNIITIHDIGKEGDMAYMALELLDGVDLQQLMKAGQVPLPRALDIAAQVAEGLAFAHEQGIVHRDIKPGNIMIVRGKHAKIMDFGIAKARVSDVKTQAGAILGSPKYMSPEQVDGQRADHRSDIFSLGVTTYELLTGVPPFDAPDLAQLMYRIATVAPKTASSLKPNVPAMVDLVLAKALDKNPDERYQSARELADDLRACMAEAAPAEDAAAPYEKTLKLPSRPAGAPADVTSAAGGGFAVPTTKVERPSGASSVPRFSSARAIDSSAARTRLSQPRLSGSAPPKAPSGSFLGDPAVRKAALAFAAALLVGLIIAFA